MSKDSFDKYKLLKPLALRSMIAAALGVAAPAMLITPAHAQEAASDLEEIVVTGSRIVRRDYDAASPIVTVGQEAFQQNSSVSVENVLNQLPQFVPSQTQFSSTDVQPSAFNTPGIATLNLRGLGANRNLVLIDGRRPQPANAQLVVDVNSIPSAAIESVEVISGGASSVYGADALAGVTNFKLKRNFEGASFDVQTSVTEQGDGEETTLSGLIGGNFDGGRGNVMIGLSASKRNSVRQADRDFYVNGWQDPNTTAGSQVPFSRFDPGRANRPTQGALDTIFGAGVATPADPIYVNYDGSVFINTASAGAVGYTGPLNDELKILGDGTLNPGGLAVNSVDQLITTPLERYTFFANANYEINDNMSVYLQGNYSSLEVSTVLNYAPATSAWNSSVPNDGRTIPTDLQTLLDSRENAAADWTLERVVDFAGPRRTQNNSDVFQLLGGIEGSFGDTTWTYDAYVSHGKTSLLTEMTGFPGVQNLRRVVAADDFGKNLNESVGPPLFYELKCETGLPIVSDFTPSQDCIDAISTNMKHLTEITQDIAEVNIQGELFELPAGVLQAAFGATYRENDYRWRPDAQLVRPSTNFPAGLFPTSSTQGKTDVSELYGEFLIPVLSDLPGIQSLDLEVGLRYSDYNTAGEIWTYKGLADWSINDTVRIRGGYQMANRAPNVAELYTGVTTSVVGFTGADPCMSNTSNTWGNHPDNPERDQAIAQCSAIINNSGANNDSQWHTDPNFPDNIVGPFPFPFALELANITGNENLKNEEAETYTLGAVFNSPFSGVFENATLSIDWYQIEISNAIAPTDAFSVYAKCLNEDGSNPNYEFNDYCKLIVRESGSGYRAAVNTPYFNLGGIETAGVDVQLNWSLDMAGGMLNINAALNYLDYYRDQQTVADDFIDATGTFANGGQFDYRTLTTVSYMRDSWSVGLRHRFLPSINSADYKNDNDTTVQGADSYNLFSAFGSYNINDSFSVRGGIDNLFDTDPEVVGRNPGTTNANGVTQAAYYDPLGRRYYIALSMNF